MSRTVAGPDGRPRCGWCAAPEFLHYHDTEWGFPVADDRRLFEKLCLEGFQSGLSWRTILGKRENFRAAFCGFDFDAVARFTEDDVERLLGDRGIVRHRGKERFGPGTMWMPQIGGTCMMEAPEIYPAGWSLRGVLA